MESTAAVSVSRCRGRSQFFTQGRGLTEQLPNKKITGRYFRHSRTHKGQHRQFTVFPGSRIALHKSVRPTKKTKNRHDTRWAGGSSARKTNRRSAATGRKPFNQFDDDLFFCFKDGRRRRLCDCESISRNFFFLLSSLTQKKWQLFQGHFALVAHLHTIVVGMSDGRDGGNQHNPPNRNQTPKEKNTTPLDCYDYCYYYTTNNNKTLFSVSF